jgi:hypothetical protein
MVYADEFARRVVGVARGWGGVPTVEQGLELDKLMLESPRCVREELRRGLLTALIGTRDGVRVCIEKAVWSSFFMAYGRFDPVDVIRRMIPEVMRLVRGWGSVPSGEDVLQLQMLVADSKGCVRLEGLLEGVERRMRSDGFAKWCLLVEQAVRVVYL